MDSEITEFEKLILDGALEPAGVDPDTGEMLYNFTKKLKSVSPELHKEINNMFSGHMMKLWEMGMVEMDVTEKNPIVKLTNLAFNDDIVASLDKEVSFTLKEIKRNLI